MECRSEGVDPFVLGDCFFVATSSLIGVFIGVVSLDISSFKPDLVLRVLVGEVSTMLAEDTRSYFAAY